MPCKQTVPVQIKPQEWMFESEIGCWYAIRQCDSCGLYWEGPDYSKTNKHIHPSEAQTLGSVNDPEELEVGPEISGKGDLNLNIYCYDSMGRYGEPLKMIGASVEDIYNFCELNKYSHGEIRVVGRSGEE